MDKKRREHALKGAQNGLCVQIALIGKSTFPINKKKGDVNMIRSARKADVHSIIVDNACGKLRAFLLNFYELCFKQIGDMIRNQ